MKTDVFPLAPDRKFSIHKLAPFLSGLMLAAGLCLGPSSASAQNSMDSGGQASDPAGRVVTPTEDDREFMTNAAIGGILEVKLGELAADKAGRDDVKKCAQKMVTDHTAINNELKTIAAQQGVPLPAMLDAKHQKIYEKLATYSGAEFESKYLALMVKAHKMDAKLFKKESATQDTDIKSFVDKTLPVIKEHLDMFEGMNKPAA